MKKNSCLVAKRKVACLFYKKVQPIIIIYKANCRGLTGGVTPSRFHFLRLGCVGRNSSNTEPFPNWLDTLMSPPCICTMRRA